MSSYFKIVLWKDGVSQKYLFENPNSTKLQELIVKNGFITAKKPITVVRQPSPDGPRIQMGQTKKIWNL